MNSLNRFAVAVAAVVTLAASLMLLTTAPAHADKAGHSPVVVTHDLDVTAVQCFPEQVRISGLYTGDVQDYWMIEVNGPNGILGGTPPLWYGSTEQDLVLDYCTGDLPAGTYTVTVDAVQRASFTVYRPELRVVEVVPPLARVAARHSNRKAVAALTLRGAPLAGTAVQVSNRFGGKVHTSTVMTDAAGQAKAKCPRGRACRVTFSYAPLALSTPTVKVAKR